MERLTTNKNTSEMGMYELAMNSCYLKDGLARYRDFEKDVDARELTRKLLKKYAEGDDAFECIDAFDDEMLDLLQYGTDTIEGLIALFYLNLWTKADLRERLKSYEDAEEQGLLLRLPCKVGDTVYCIRQVGDGKGTKEIVEFNITRFFITRNNKILMVNNYTHTLNVADIGNFVFLTREEAEQALAEEGCNYE